jgi:DNA-binding transcriptional ArsR family regulator
MDSILIERVGAEKLMRASEMLRVAAHPMRLAVLDLLGAQGRLCVSEMVERLGAEQAILSQHLSVMRERGLLAVERLGRYSYYRVAQPGFLSILRQLENCCDKL